MKNLFDTLAKGNLGNIGDKLSGALGGQNPLAGMGDKLSSALGGQNNAAAGNNGTTGAMGAMGGMGNLGGLLGAGALGGLLGALMSGKTAQKVAKGALVVGGTAAVGALAWNFYQKWSQNAAAQQPAPAGQGGQAAMPYAGQPQQCASPSGWSAKLNPLPEESIAQAPPTAALPPAEDTALLLLEAMVFAARADGHIDATEQQHIHQAVSSMFPERDMAPLVDGLLQKPLDPASLAARVHTAEEAHDLYRLSCMIVDVDHFMERSYMDGLAAALHIPVELKNQLEQEVAQAKAANAQ